MNLFNEQGHLTNEALQELCSGNEIDELSRLELAEHLSFCDHCLMAYTQSLSDSNLTPPAPNRAGRLWRSIQLHAFSIASSRLATAAAAIGIVFALWGFGIFGGLVSASGSFSSNEQTFLSTMLHYCETISSQTGNVFERLNDTIWVTDLPENQHNLTGGSHP